MKTLFKKANLLYENGSIQPDTDLLVENGIIQAIGKDLPTYDASIEACEGLYLSPGLTVLHAHSPMHILRGIAEDVSVDRWFNEFVFPYESKLTSEDAYWGARLCCAEMLDNGVTAFADHYFFCDEVLKAAQDSGIRIDLAVTIFSFNFQQAMDTTRRLLDQTKHNPTSRVRYGPHSPYLLSPKELAEIVQAAKNAETGIHLHLSETLLQQTESLEKYGKTPVQIVAEAGGFTLPCIVAHGLWIPEQDLPLLAQDTYVAACAKTYMKLGMEKGTLWDNKNKLNLCIGTDGAVSSNSARPLEQAQLFALCGKWANQPENFTLVEMWQMLMNGHNALPFGTGKLAPGAPADLVVWDLNQPGSLPLHNPLASLLYSATASNVLHTMVNGHFQKYNGKLCGDTQEIMDKAALCAKELTRRGKGDAKVVF